MILKSLKLENIRSYKQHEVKFPVGITLFEGDIGSGKTTLLMAIEFALFGLGSEKAGALLRTNELKGIVDLCFEVDGEVYEIQRTLIKKGRTVQQGDGFIKSKDGILNLSPSELKERILNILSFNEPPDPKAQSNIYRYAIFTPQEEMKAILFMSPDSRLQTLRKAFRIEDYKIAHDNSQNIATSIEKKADFLRATASDLDVLKKTFERIIQEISKDKEELSILLSKEQTYDEVLKSLKNQQGSLNNKREKLSRVQGEIPEVDKQIKRRIEDRAEFETIVKKAIKKINEYTIKLEELSNIEKPTDKSIEQLNRERLEFKKNQRQLIESQSAIGTKIQDYIHIEQKGICPTCDREANSTDFKVKIEEKMTEKSKLVDLLVQCDKHIDENQKLIDRLKDYNDAQKRMDELKEQISEQKQAFEENDNKAKILSVEINKLKKRLDEANQELEKFKELSEELIKLEVEVEKTDKVLKEVSKQVSVKKGKIEETKRRIDELNHEINNKEEKIKKSSYLSEYSIFLRDYFISAIENIERHVLIIIHQEFNHYFQHWFSSLVEDSTKDARIDEEFTPIIEQDGYEQDINYLSGGERTSVALAYRLALNMLVCKVSTSMKSSLLILDEPTDGFSKEQLFKIQDILKELQCPQIIIVSHEKELESFADQVYKITKINGVSRVGV